MTTEMRPTRHLIDARIGVRVASRRAELKLSKAEVARSLGIAEGELSHRESGAHSFLPVEIVQLAVLLNVNPGWFFEGIGVNSTDHTHEA